MWNSTDDAVAGRRRERRIDEKPMKMGFCGAEKWLWTLAMALHIRAAMPSWANQVRENKMAKKSKKPLKKAKKLEATKPLTELVGLTKHRL
jgi:hypothetical protein